MKVLPPVCCLFQNKVLFKINGGWFFIKGYLDSSLPELNVSLEMYSKHHKKSWLWYSSSFPYNLILKQEIPIEHEILKQQ